MTIIFADRWEQCEQLSEALKKRGVKADAIYSHVDANPGSAESRNRRTSAENAKVLQAFRDGKDACQHGNDPENHRPFFQTPEAIPIAEPSEELKDRVKSRDGFRCLCCGYSKLRSKLQVDHMSPSYHGGGNHFDNLQTLCKDCNGPAGKGIDNISFRNNQTTLTTSPSRLPLPKPPSGVHAKSAERWEMFLRRTINLFFRCAAVDTVEIGGRGPRFRHWQIRLFPGNNEAWLKPYLPDLIQRIREAREGAGYEAAPDKISVTS